MAFGEWDEAKRDAVMSVSGRIAEERARGGSSPWGWEDDWAHAEAACDEAGISMSEAEDEARRLVNSNWGSISREAGRL